MDLFIIHGIVEELQDEILGGFVTKIYQMNRTDLLFRLHRHGAEKQLLISTHPNFHRLHLTWKKYANPVTPPRFCTYLRKHISGARVANIFQEPYERVVRIPLQKRMDAGVVRNLVLVTELIGKGSNVLLLNEKGQILDCLHFKKPEEGGRTAMPGLTYVPPQQRPSPSLKEMTREKMEGIAALPPGQRWKALAEAVSGISPLIAREAEFRSTGTPSSMWETWQALLSIYQEGTFNPRIVTLLEGKKILCPFPLASLGEAAAEIFPSMNRAADAFYFEAALHGQLGEQKLAISKRLRQLLDRLDRRRAHLLEDREKFEKDLRFKKLGELLLTNYPKLRRGMAEVEVTDFQQDPPQPVTIELDASLGPAGNVEWSFKRYKKAKRGLEVLHKRLPETEEEISYLESVLFQVEEVEDGKELEEVRQELEEGRVLKVPRKRKAAKEPLEQELPFRRFRSSEGLEIFCGKNSRGNDLILRKMALGEDLWFHAQGFPGAHVLLKAARSGASLISIEEAASIAAFFSRGRGSTRVPVDYTPVKNLRKPKGARPGVVTYSNQKTIFVRPEREEVEKLSTL